MKKLTVLVLIALLATSAVMAGCSSTSKTSDTSASSAAGSTNGETKSEETTKAAETKAEETTKAASKEVVVYDNNGIKLTYLGYEKDIFPELKFKLENTSDKSYSVSTEDVSINDSMISTGIFESIASGKKSMVDMTMLESDLEDNGIDKIEKVEFKLRCTNSNDFMDSFESDIITINNP